jgi:transcriptional regulator with XRE-family HTH domain
MPGGWHANGAERRRGRGVSVIPERVRQARLERGMSLAQVAGHEVSRAFIHLVEQGIARPSLPVLELIAARTGKRPDYFLNPREESRIEVMVVDMDRSTLMRSLEQLRRHACPQGPDADGCDCRFANRGDDGRPVGEAPCTGCADLELVVRMLEVMSDGMFGRLARLGSMIALPRAGREL